MHRAAPRGPAVKLWHLLSPVTNPCWRVRRCHCLFLFFFFFFSFSSLSLCFLRVFAVQLYSCSHSVGHFPSRLQFPLKYVAAYLFAVIYIFPLPNLFKSWKRPYYDHPLAKCTYPWRTIWSRGASYHGERQLRAHECTYIPASHGCI